MAKILKQVSFNLAPDSTGLGYSICTAVYTVGSTDDVTFSTLKTLPLTLANNGDLNQIKNFWSSWLAQVKTVEGIK